MNDKKSVLARVNQQLADQLMKLFEEVFKERRNHYHKAEHKTLDKSQFDRIKKSYAAQNATITAAINMVPGSWGLVGIVPEIVLVSRNQLAMIYDIARLHGKEGQLNAQLMAYVFGSGFGFSVGALGVIHGGKLLVKRSSLRAFQKIILALAGKITQKALKAAIAKFLPLAGATLLSGWAYYTTCVIADLAHKIFAGDIIFEDGPDDQQSAVA